MRSFLGRHFLALALTLSVVLHALVGFLGYSAVEPPRLKPVQSGKAYISLRSSPSAGPKPAEAVVTKQALPQPAEKKAPPPRPQSDRPKSPSAPKAPRAVEKPSPPPAQKTPAAVTKKTEKDQLLSPSKSMPQVISDKVSQPSRGSVGARGAQTDGPANPLASNPAPEYPPEMLLERSIGSVDVVELSIQVDAKGGVTGVRVVRSSGFEPFDQAALEAVRRWEFEPARRAGVAVPYENRQVIEFYRRR
jgi:periplasmic protein TonB